MSSVQAFRSILALAAVVVALALLPQTAKANQKGLIKDFKELWSIANRLESAEMTLQGRTPQQEKVRNDLLYLFARDTKSDRCNSFYEYTKNLANDFRVKAYMYLDDLKKGNSNWFSNIIPFGNPLGALKNMAKWDAYLHSVVERYENTAKSAPLSHTDVDCDLKKFEIRRLFSILFVLQTDIKYLVTEDSQVQNKAIYEALKADKFVSSSNFYEVLEVTPEQNELLLQFFADRVDKGSTSIADSLDHFHSPSKFILGRLLDSCQSAIDFENELETVERSNDEVCASRSDSNAALFAKQYPRGKYEDTVRFCQALLDAL